MPFATKHSSHLVGAIVFAFIMVCSGNAAQTAEMTPANIRLDFIIGGKHAPWYVALEKGFYAKRGLSATIQASTGSADTVRTVASGGADFGFADLATMIVAKSRGTPVQAAAQFGYVGATILWRDEGQIKSIKDLEGKSLAISPGQAQWYLMPAYCRINKIDFKAIKIQETAAPIQPAALATKKADFIIMFRASNDEIAEQAASKVGVKLSRVFMKDTGLDIYGTSLIVKDDDVKKRPEFVRAYVEGTLEGLRIRSRSSGRGAQDSAQAQTRARSSADDVAAQKCLDRSFPAFRIRPGRLGLYEAGHHGKNRQGDQRVFRRRPQGRGQRSLHQPIHQALIDSGFQGSRRAAADRSRGHLPSFYRRREDRFRAGKRLL